MDFPAPAEHPAWNGAALLTEPGRAGGIPPAPAAGVFFLLPKMGGSYSKQSTAMNCQNSQIQLCFQPKKEPLGCSKPLCHSHQVALGSRDNSIRAVCSDSENIKAGNS